MLSDHAQLRRDNTHQLLCSVRFVQQIAMHDLISLRIDDMTAQAIGGARIPASSLSRRTAKKHCFSSASFVCLTAKKKKNYTEGRAALNAFPLLERLICHPDDNL